MADDDGSSSAAGSGTGAGGSGGGSMLVRVNPSIDRVMSVVVDAKLCINNRLHTLFSLRFMQISDVSVLLMDDVLHKLHCLNYEREYCEMKDVQPFHRVYFALPSPHSG